MVHFIWHVMTERHFSLPLTKVDIHFGHVRMFATHYPIFWIILISDLGPRYTDKLLEKGTSRQRLGKGAIRKRFPLQKPRWEKNQTNNQVLIP